MTLEKQQKRHFRVLAVIILCVLGIITTLWLRRVPSTEEVVDSLTMAAFTADGSPIYDHLWEEERAANPDLTPEKVSQILKEIVLPEYERHRVKPVIQSRLHDRISAMAAGKEISMPNGLIVVTGVQAFTTDEGARMSLANILRQIWVLRNASRFANVATRNAMKSNSVILGAQQDTRRLSELGFKNFGSMDEDTGEYHLQPLERIARMELKP